MKLLRATFLALILSTTLSAEIFAQQELTAALNEISSQLKTVKTATSEWKQSFRSNPARPYVVIYEAVGADKKGQTVTQVYEFNLADIDPSSIKHEAKKEEMLVKMRTLKSNGFIIEKQGDQLVRYVGELTLYAEQVDNARAITEAFKKSVPLAKAAMDGRVKIENRYSYLTTWLTNNIVTATVGDDIYRQTVSFVDGFKNLKVKLIRLHEQKGKSEEEFFDFNLGDIDNKDIEMGVSGKWIYLELPTRAKLGYIRYVKNGKVQSSEKSVRLYFDDVEKAREGKMILEKLLPLSEPIREEFKPVYSNLTDGLKKIKAAITKAGDTEQSILQECQTVLSVTEGGKTTEYRFFWGDLDESSAKIKASGKVFELSLEAKDRQKFIETWKNGEKQNYVSSLEILAEDIETIRFLPLTLNKVITDCRTSVKSTLPAGGIDAQVGYMNASLKNSQNLGKTTSQVLEKTDKCLIQFKRTTSEGKSGGDFRYELSLAELDPSSVEIGISGSNVFVTASTRGKEKNIKSFKAEVPSDYLNTVKIECENIIVARQVRDSLAKVITDCKK